MTFAKTSAIAIAAMLAFAQIPIAEAQSRKAGRIAGGIAAGIAGAIIINELSKSQRRNDYSYGSTHYDRPRHSCRSLDRKCDRGHGWACRKFDREC